MNKIEKLEKILKEWDLKEEQYFQEANFARKHNFRMEVINLEEKHRLIRDLLREIRMKVSNESI